MHSWLRHRLQQLRQPADHRHRCRVVLPAMFTRNRTSRHAGPCMRRSSTTRGSADGRQIMPPGSSSSYGAIATMPDAREGLSVLIVTCTCDRLCVCVCVCEQLCCHNGGCVIPSWRVLSLVQVLREFVASAAVDQVVAS
jgi:hypothetical protein